jgi:conjugal transfer pilus assembly protein TraF
MRSCLRVCNKPLAALLQAAALVVCIHSPASNAQDVSEKQNAKPERSTTAIPPSEFWRNKSEGWFWYKDPAKEDSPANAVVEKPAIKPAPVKPAKPIKTAEVLAHETLTQRADELMKIAFINPTKENVEAYLRLQTLVVNKSSQFADAWQRVIWENPDMDFASQGRPVNSAAISVYDKELDLSKRKVIANLAQEHSLMFFFKSDCPYCHQFAPLLKNFEAAYGIKIFPVSLDGRGLPDFPSFRTDSGQAANLKVSSVPAVFLVNPGTGQIKPIGFGILSESELANRLYTVTVDPDIGSANTKSRSASQVSQTRRVP